MAGMADPVTRRNHMSPRSMRLAEARDVGAEQPLVGGPVRVGRVVDVVRVDAVLRTTWRRRHCCPRPRGPEGVVAGPGCGPATTEPVDDRHATAAGGFLRG